MGPLGGEERELRGWGAGTEGKGMCEGRDQASFPFYLLASASPAAISSTLDHFSKQQSRPWEPGMCSRRLLPVRVPLFPTGKEGTAHSLLLQGLPA